MPVHTKPRRSKRGVKLNIREYDNSLEYQIKEIFIGQHTLFSVLGFIVGGVLVGSSLWQYSIGFFGLAPTLVIGIVIFTISGIALERFHK